jgi:hypothetical protein
VGCVVCRVLRVCAGGVVWVWYAVVVWTWLCWWVVVCVRVAALCS